MTGGYLIFFTEGLCLMFFTLTSILFLTYNQGRLRKLMAGCLAFWMLLHLKEVFVVTHFDFTQMEVERLRKCLDVLAVPTCAFVGVELLRPGWFNARRCAAHMVLFAALSGTTIFTGSMTAYYVMLVAVVVYGVSLSVYGLVQIPRYNRNLKDIYSFTDDVSLQWLVAVLVIFLSMLMLWLAASYKLDLEADSLFHLLSMALWAIVAYYVSRHANMKPADLEPDPSAITATDADAQPAADEFESRLLHDFVGREEYLKPQLKLADMARTLGTNRTYLSNYLNSIRHTTFYDYVNDLRLKHSCRLLLESDLTLDVVAERSGFNSLSTFRRVFAKRMGMTPNAYRQSRSGKH